MKKFSTSADTLPNNQFDFLAPIGEKLFPAIKQIDTCEPFFFRKLPVWKRVMDIFGAIFCLIIFSPVMVVIALAIKLTSRGPIFFKQKRVGMGGIIFTFFKFRSMYHNCDQNIHQKHILKLSNGDIDTAPNGQSRSSSYKLPNDERITNLGKFLRRTSLDELPQLFNVLKGDMSLVGPRPYPLYQTKTCSIWQRARLSIKPGITGLGQVYGRFNCSFIDAYRLDVQYIRKYSLWLDFKILFKTISLVFSGRGAQ